MMNGVFVAGLAGTAFGAGLMYLADPGWGRKRRATVRDKAVRGVHEIEAATVRTALDVSHRARGVRARIGRLFDRGPVDDEVLEQRVRAKLGRLCSHPHAVDVYAESGRVELSGPVLASEVDRLVRGVARVPGVADVENRLDVHERPENVPSLQSAATPWRRQPRWTPTARLLSGATGAGLLAYAALRGPGENRAVCLAGTALVLRSLSSRNMRELVSLGTGRQGIEIQKIVEFDAPVSEVFALWSKFESFPRFLSHVKNVSRTESGEYQWEVTGPAGTTVTWLAEVSRFVPNRLIAWHSVPGAVVGTKGEVRFRPSELGGTRLEIRLAYWPPAGALGHAVATLLGANPRKQIDDDMLRVKSLLEDGKATGRGTQVDREEIIPSPPPERMNH